MLLLPCRADLRGPNGTLLRPMHRCPTVTKKRYVSGGLAIVVGVVRLVFICITKVAMQRFNPVA